ncbi:MAG: hypothetical protein KDK70_05795 [Myxococcales bacterium]|nr:hypothetical protein [Myxococcales bacterium]
MTDPRDLQPLLDALTARAALVGPRGTLLSTNRAWREAEGHPMAGAHIEPGEDYLRALSGVKGRLQTDAMRVASALQRVLDGEAEAPSHTYRHGASAALWTRTSLCPIEGNPRCVAVLHEDVTAQLKAQHALQRSQARLRTILTGAPIVLFSIDRHGVFTVVEGMGGAGTGFVSEDQVGTSIYETYRHMPDLLDVVRDALGGRVGVITQSVGPLAFEIRCSPVVRDDAVVGVVGVATDVTERLRAQRMKDEFVSIVSHELRTPLTSIRGSLGLLEGGVAGALPTKAADLVRIARSNTDRLIRLINDILDLDKMQAGRVTLEREPLEPRALIDEVIAHMRGYAEQTGVHMEVIDRACEPILGDHDRLVQVLTNLLSNAIKFSPEGETVTIRLTPTNHRVRISVTDRGPGIAQADIPKLFKKFHQLDPSDARARGGSGLGLVIAKTLVEAHGGRIGVDSEIGRGSTFHFEVPCTRPRVTITPRVSQSGTYDPAVAIDPTAIVDPRAQGPRALVEQLAEHVRAAAEADDLDALSDAQATARILESALPPADATRGRVSRLARSLDEVLRDGRSPGTARWHALQREIGRIHELLAP